MAYDDYKGQIDFSKIRVLALKRGVSISALGRAMGTTGSYCQNIMAGRFIPNTETLAKMCGALECSVDDLVAFRGFEVKDFYRGRDPFIPHKADGDALYRTSFEPLRNLLMSVYGADRFKVKFRELLSKIEPVGGNETQLRNIAVINERHKAKNESNGSSGKGHQTIGKINVTKQACFRHDRPLNLRYVYNVCELLGCTPAWVLTYK